MGSSFASPSTACSASQAQFAGHLGAWDGADAKLMEGLRDCVRRLLVAIDGTGPWKTAQGGIWVRYRYIARTGHLCWPCRNSASNASRPGRWPGCVTVACTGGAGLSWHAAAVPGTPCRQLGAGRAIKAPAVPRAPFCCAAGRYTCNGSAGKAILQARLFAQPLASSSTYRIQTDALYVVAAMHSCSDILFQCLR
ncbi:hypothetical protein HDV63DRAFT_13795 [Trichoderma sp. SZMC 28014]